MERFLLLCEENLIVPLPHENRRTRHSRARSCINEDLREAVDGLMRFGCDRRSLPDRERCSELFPKWIAQYEYIQTDLHRELIVQSHLVQMEADGVFGEPAGEGDEINALRPVFV